MLDWWLNPERIDFIPETGCWVSHAALSSEGYPWVGVKKGGKTRKLGHLVLDFFVGPRPDGMHMCHSCDVPACVNPDHLRWDTRSANMQDKVRRGRANIATGDRSGSRAHPESRPRGENNSNAKLTEQNVRSMRHIYDMGFVSQRALARMFNVSAHTINTILARKGWRHVP